MKRLAVFLLLILFSGCTAGLYNKKIYIPEKLADVETRQKVAHILKKVKKIAQEHELDYLGRSTMSESVEIMDLGAGIVPVLIENLKQSNNWKFNFWIVDILGYIKNRGNILPLIEVIEDDSEAEIVRLRACESLREIKFPQALEHLVISRDLVKNYRVKEEIEKTIQFFR